MSILRKVIMLFTLVIALSCYAEEQTASETGTDIASLTAKITEMEAKLDKLSKQVEKMQADIDRLNDSNAKLAKAMRNLELATQYSASTRPDADAWGGVKKGMSAEEVSNLLGNPEEIEERKNGDVWYYYGLGSITFDRTDRVLLQNTFKELPIEKKVR